MRIASFQGLNIEDDPLEVGLDGLVVANNIDLSKKNKPSRRAGFASAYAGTITAAWGDDDNFLFVEGTELKRLNADMTATTVAQLTAPSTVLRGVTAYDNCLYWTTLLDSGVIDNGANRPWGVLKPTSFYVSDDLGDLPEAGYKVGLAYVHSRGVEGPMAYSYNSLAGGVSVRIPHTVSELAANDIERVRLYVSLPDGEVLYQAEEIAVGDSSYITYGGDATDLGVAAEANNTDNMPTDGFLEEHGGRLWSSTRRGNGGVVVCSNPYSELTNLLKNFFVLEDEITGIGSVGAGLIVGTTEAVYFLRGDDVEQMSATKMLSYGMIPGTMVKADGRRVGEGINARVVLWASERGMCMGSPGLRGDGEVANLTEARVGTLTGTTGAAILRRANGQNHLLTVLRS